MGTYGDWCGECGVDPDTGEVNCAPEPFPEVQAEVNETCERCGHGHGGSLACFVRRDADSPWYFALVGGAEEGNEEQDAQVSAAVSAFHDLLGRGVDGRPATLDMLGGAGVDCDGSESVIVGQASGPQDLQRAPKKGATFAARYAAHMALTFQPGVVKVRLAYARMLLQDGDRRGAYGQLLTIRALTAEPAVLARIKRDPAFKPIASEALFGTIVDPSRSLTPCRVPDEWRESEE